MFVTAFTGPVPLYNPSKTMGFSYCFLFNLVYNNSTMSYFGGGSQQAQTINPQNIALAEQELEMVTDLFNR